MSTITSNIDIREQLYNDRQTGLITEVVLPAERITSLHGLMIDLDPPLYQPDNPFLPASDDPQMFFENIKPLLERHPLAQNAEVRCSRRGLHIIIWLQPAAELKSAADQEQWNHLVGVVQCTLPGDPNAPGITAVTRAVGSVNAKNNAEVKILKQGEPVTPAQVEEFVTQVAKTPFKEVAKILLGGESISPCPVCRKDGSTLNVLDHIGKCYHCGKVSYEALLDCVYVSTDPKKLLKDKTKSTQKDKVNIVKTKA